MTSLSRKLLITGVTAAAALAITACTPPNENDSDAKVDTATGVAAPTTETSARTTTTAGTTTAIASAELPGYIDCVAAPTREPQVISLNCADNSDQLTAIEWVSWDEDGATGTGTRIVTATVGDEEVIEDVDVELSAVTETSQGLVFSQVEVDGQVVAL
ncbi:hypothetical protein [Corynebacterium gallinarum]|uniref:Secreted protein n=1 Tax=Corynebacterium gallinarum TaxID=2762214 RepID=A0A8I0LCU4_9CORY|nr:hypothetical protein [Corynebacterium gallinarum]MBD8030811.1 hypothetical protein [Corynebacterium gallinarum]